MLAPVAEQAGLEPAHRSIPMNGLAIRRSTKLCLLFRMEEPTPMVAITSA